MLRRKPHCARCGDAGGCDHRYAGQPGETFRVIDTFYQEQAFRLITLNYSPQAPLREHPLDAPIRLPINPLPEPDPELPNGIRYVQRGCDGEDARGDIQRRIHRHSHVGTNNTVWSGPSMG